MEVFLIPLGPGRYELYCEVDDDGDPADDEADASSGVVKRMIRRFRELLRHAERERHRPQVAAEKRSWTRRVRDRALRWMAEKIAEQRLLWQLRRQVEASAVYPDDVTADEAMRILRGALKRDADRHRLWMIVDTVGLVVSVILVVIPGPNVLAYYFIFRVVGHYLSMRGARQGLMTVDWHPQSSPLLADLRRAIALEPAERARRVDDIAAGLRLERLPTFVQRTVLPRA